MKKFHCNYKILFLASFLFFINGLLQAQGTGSWKSYLSCYNTTNVLETPNKVFALASGCLLSYSPEDSEVKVYGKMDGLNDVNIVHIAYSEETNTLLLAYESGDLDILTSSSVFNVPFIKNKTNYTDKTINSLDVFGKFIYVSGAFGVSKVNMQQKEIEATYEVGNIISSCVKGDYIYVATPGGIYRGLTTKNLVDKANWTLYDPEISDLNLSSINKILLFQNAMIFAQYDNGIFYKSDTNSGLMLSGKFRNVKIVKDQLVGILSTSVHLWSDLTTKTQMNSLNIYDIASRKQNIYWVAQGTTGLKGIQKSTGTTYTTYKSDIVINSPRNNKTFAVKYQQNKILVTGGSHGADRGNVEGTLMVLDETGKWYSFDPKEIETDVKAMYPSFPSYKCLDFIAVAVDPRDRNHYYVTTYGEGMIEFKNNKLVKIHNFNNSPLLSVLLNTESEKYHFIRLGDLIFDTNNNLVVTTIKRKSPIQILAADGENWLDIDSHYNFDTYGPPIGNIILTSKNQKWITSPRYGYLYVIEDNGTPYNFSDDKFYIFNNKNSIKDQNGEAFLMDATCGIAEDQKGNIWVGTSNGVIILYNPTNAIKDPDRFYCTRPILPYNDGTDDGYPLLEYEKVNGIAVDGANRKWLATDKSGAYLVSENGLEIIKHFTKSNSPLISDKINSVAINPNTGEVFFATDKGLVSYMGDASTGRENYSEVRAYPNPVRPEDNSLVTITNLVMNSTVKITDMRGNLIVQGISKGGTYIWNCTDKTGARVKTGIYLVFAANPDGTEGVVTKIMVVK